MSQQDEISRNDYDGNGSTVEFPYTFRILDRTQILVSLIEIVDDDIIETIQVIDDDYDVDGVGNSGGGTVTFFVAPPTGMSIVLVRNVPFSQTAGFPAHSPFPASTVETSYDKLTQIAQELRQTQSTALKPPTMPNFIDGTLPSEIEPLDILQINETLDGFVANSIQIVFGAGPLTAHQLVQLGNISDTTTISTPQWDFLGLMDQGVATTDAVTFTSVNGATNLSDISNLTSAEITQLTNIDSAVISTVNWSFVASLDQALGTTDSPTFAGITIDGEDLGTTSIHANQNFNSGSIENGNLSIASATTFNISAGSGIVVDYSTDLLDPDTIEVSWTTFSGVALLNMASNNFKSIAIDSAGAITQKDGQFTEMELRDLIPIGVIIHNTTDILDVLDITRKSIGRHDVTTDLLSTIGILNRSGNVYSANGVNLNIDKTSGESFGLSLNSNISNKLANITTDTAGVALSFTPIHKDGSGGWTILSSTTTVDVGNYDDGSGVLQALNPSQATNHRLAYEARTGRTFFLYGQTLYSTLTVATDAVPDGFDVIDVIIVPVDVRAILSSRGAAADLSLSTDAVFTEVNKLGGTSGGTTAPIQAASLQTAYDQDPAVVLTAANPVDIEVNTDTDKALMLRDSSSTETYSATGEGNVNQKGTLFLEGITNNTEQLLVTGSATQGVNALTNIRNFATESITQNYEDRTEFKKRIHVISTQDAQVPLKVTGSAAPTDFLFQVQDNALNDLMTLDKDGELLINGAELESGSGEVVIAYAEYDVLSTDTQLDFIVPPPDDPDIVALRVEVRDIQVSELGNPPGTSNHVLSIGFSIDNGVSYLTSPDNYQSKVLTDGVPLTDRPQNGTLTVGPLSDSPLPVHSVFSKRSSATVHVNNIPEALEDGMSVSSISTNTVNDFGASQFICSMSGGFVPNPGEGQESDIVTNIRIYTSVSTGAPSLLNLVAGSIKVVGIKRGGP